MRRYICGALALALLAGCGGGSSPKQIHEDAAPTSSSSSTTLVQITTAGPSKACLDYIDSSTTALRQLVDAFNLSVDIVNTGTRSAADVAHLKAVQDAVTALVPTVTSTRDACKAGK